MSADTVAAGGPSREDARRATRKGRPVLMFLVVVLVLVNIGATAGQAGWFFNNATFTDWLFPLRLALAVVLALAVELTGVYLSMEADDARRADQPSLVLQLGAYGVGGFAGWLNWDHFHGLPGNGPDLAKVFAGLSIASPVLWAIWSKARHRLRLVELGQAGKRGVKLSSARKVWHPIKSVRVMSFAAWEGITNEDEAVRGWEQHRKPVVPDPWSLDVFPAPVSPAPTNGHKGNPSVWARALDILAQEPNLSLPELGDRLGYSERWLRECRKAYEAIARTLPA